MQIDPKLKVRKVVKESIVILPPKSASSPTSMMALNPTSLFLWENLQGKDFTAEDAVDLLCANYEVERERAAADVDKWIEQMKEAGALK